MKNSLPVARAESLIVKELTEETLVYDLDRNKAYCLNHAAALVWKYCDGRKTVRQIANLLESELEIPLDSRFVWLALDQLEKVNLLRKHINKPPLLTNLSRRQLVRTLGLLAASIPLVTSIVAPVPAQAATLLSPGACCNNPNECVSNSCLQNPVCVGMPSTKACT